MVRDTAWRLFLTGACFKSTDMYARDMMCWERPYPHDRYMALFPLKVQAKFMFDLYTKGGAEHLLLDKTLCPGKSMAALYRDLKQVREHDGTPELVSLLLSRQRHHHRADRRLRRFTFPCSNDN